MKVIANECEAIHGPDLVATDAAADRKACKCTGSNSMFKSRRARAGSIRQIATSLHSDSAEQFDHEALDRLTAERLVSRARNDMISTWY